MRIAVSTLLGFWFASVSIAQEQTSPPRPEESASIQIVEGDGAINSIRFHRGHDPVVRLLTPAGKPIAGAAVTFLLPASGPSGTFGDSGLSLTVPTGADGTAAGRGLRPNNMTGQFRIRIIASWNGSPASAALVETNAEPAPHPGRSKKIALIAIIAGAAAGGVAAAVAHKSSSSSSGASLSLTPGSISAGTPSIGPN